MIPPAKVQSVPTAVIVFGWIPRRTSQLATGSMTLRYPFLSQSGRIFMRLGLDAKRALSRQPIGETPHTLYTPHLGDAVSSHRERMKPERGSGRKGRGSTEL